jgi:GT2 family glycosyltransferase
MPSPSDGGAGSGPRRFSIVVPTYDRLRRLAACLDALAALDYPRDAYEVVVVDDGSSTPLDDVVAAHAGDATVRLHRQANAGPACARNAGLAHATGDWLAFTDDDCAPEPGWLAALAAAADAHPDALLGGHTTNGLDGNRCAAASQLLVTYLYEELRAGPGEASEPAFFASNNIAAPAGRLRDLGGFDAAFPLAAGEDRDLCDRWRHAGGRLVHVPEAVVVHRHDLDLRGYWRQHAAYGRGAYRFHRARAARGGGRVRLEPSRFYARLVARPFRDGPAPRALELAGLLGLSQVANAAGYATEWLGDRPERTGR